MLIGKLPNPPATKPTTAYSGAHVVQLIGGLLCPRCRRELRATDVDLDRLGGVFVCRGCHVDIARIERR